MSTRAHAFVAMPFGTKPDRDGKDVHFNLVFSDLIKPAVEAAGLTCSEPTRSSAPVTSVSTCSRSC